MLWARDAMTIAGFMKITNIKVKERNCKAGLLCYVNVQVLLKPGIN